MEERKEANKQVVRENWHKEDQLFKNHLFAIAQNANFYLHQDAKSKHFLFL